MWISCSPYPLNGLYTDLFLSLNSSHPMYLIFDTETTGLPHNYTAPVEDLENWPRLVQLAWQFHGSKGELKSSGNYIIKPEGFTIPFNAQKIHGVSTARALKEGHDLKEVLEIFKADLEQANEIVGHNIEFDNKIIGAEFLRKEIKSILLDQPTVDTSQVSIEFCQLQGGLGGKLKAPKLIELYQKLFGESFEDAHDASYDVHATAKCFFGLIHEGVIKPVEGVDLSDIEYEVPELDEANFAQKTHKASGNLGDTKVDISEIKGAFSHLHVHSQYSVLQATPNIAALIKKTKESGMPAIALTDLGNMFGAFQFVRDAHRAGIKPIVGCEFYLSNDRKTSRFTKDNPDRRFTQSLLAKNKEGYHNLSKLSSLGFIEGLYGLFPRIDKELVKEYRGNLIALSGSLTAEIPSLILNVGETQAEKAFQWWLDLFEDDFYVELIRHNLEEENHLNEVLYSFAQKYGVKVLASNDVYYIEKNDATAHDVLLCIKENERVSNPVGRGRGFRKGFPNHEFYFKSQDEMKELFSDIPEAIENISGLVDKIEDYKLERKVLLPKFDIPSEFVDKEDEKDKGNRGENAYLKHLTFEGAKKRYETITPEIEERLLFELETIEKTGYPGYFLIVQDFTSKAREMGVSVGPGRGSAAGSAVAYCIKITNVDPIAYDLLFERFLNPDRVSLPDIDIDFDDEGRDKVIKYVIEKYGFNQVAQIITYGTMAAKSSIRDAGRVMELSLPETDAIAKLIPERPGTTLSKAFKEIPELAQLKKGDDLQSNVIKQAEVIEGSVRSTGTHACGVIITPDDIMKYVPVATAKESDLLVTQFDNSVVESAGMLKMDFLGLKTLSIIKTAIANIEKRHGVKIDEDTIPLDDQKTYELYQKGETNGTFQFESAGMQKYLRGLKPDRFQDLIAMNALYRPGPMEYIPNFINRKHGTEEISYDAPEMEEYLAETYGITVYQEQVMLLSQKLAGFTKGEADSLRKGMGKKKKEIIDALKPKFLEGCKKNGVIEEKAEKIWSDWESFAAYAFNKSHSTCYSIVAYHTAYLKANYPAEYMAAVLTHNQSNIDKVGFFMEECRSYGLEVLGPHINESFTDFQVNKKGEIRFGLGAIKGTGEAAVAAIIEEREENGHYTDIFDFSERIYQKSVNKKTFECLAMSGAFDCFKEFHRRQYLVAPTENESSLIEMAIKYAEKTVAEKNSSQVSLFGGDSNQEIMKPRVQAVEPYGEIEKLNIEREVVGLYITGHPLDQFKLELDHFCNTKISELKEIGSLAGKKAVRIGGIVTAVAHRTTKTGKPFGTLTIEDYRDSHTFFLFSSDYLTYKEYLVQGWFLFIQGALVPAPSWKKSDEEELKIQSIMHLSEVRDKMTKGLRLDIDLDGLNEQ